MQGFAQRRGIWVATQETTVQTEGHFASIRAEHVSKWVASMSFSQNFVSDRSNSAGFGLDTRARRGMFGRGLSPSVHRAIFTSLAIGTDIALIVAGATVIGAAYHEMAYDSGGSAELHMRLGLVIAALFAIPGILRNDYAIQRFLGSKGQIARCFTLWNMAFASAILLGFLTKTSADVSRGTVLLFYVFGFGAVASGRMMLTRLASHGDVASRRVFLIGSEQEVELFNQRYKPSELGLRVVSASILRGPDTLRDDLALAAASARILRPDDIYILVPWSETDMIDACIDALLRVPATLHLGPERVLDRFSELQIEHLGPISSLRLARRPLSGIEIFGKRCMDIVLSTCGLIALAPLFAATAIMIKLDSPGPVFFFQRRYGFNQQPFRIVKFRSMSTMEDGRHVEQARSGDARITRIGQLLRRFNIDELPQLFNVLRGDMSLVGPRPHALAHDQHYVNRIALYARRHNVKPGITGWAQVNGLRGETSTPNKMQRRVEHDLYYIDNWSFTLDIKILFLTVFSRKAYQNAV